MSERLNALPDRHVCETARLSRDARFDGLFFTAVSSTGIYCRPVCPAQVPKRENVSYFANAATAEAAGYRPCLRCRPELAPGHALWQRGDQLVARALKLIDTGALEDQSLEQLATRLDIGARQLRRLFVERVGASPIRVHTTRRLLFAKQLLTETAMPITDVALASGFRSLRRFNAAFAQANRIAPSELRRHPRHTTTAPLELRLGYRPPYDFAAMLAFFRGHAMPGLEQVDADSYARVFGPASAPGWLRLSAWPNGEHALRLQWHCPRPSQLLGVITRLRRMFDLDANPQAIAETFQDDALLGPLITRRPGLRLPGGWDGFEIAVRAIIGQQISVAGARTLASRTVQRFGQALPLGAIAGLDRLFPTPDVLAHADLQEIGLTRTRAATVRGMAQALLDGRVDFRPEQTLDHFVSRWIALPGIGEWTAHYIAMRALSDPDAFPAADLILRREAAIDGVMPSTKALTTRAESWRPWRAYAVMHLWRGWADAATAAKIPRHEGKP
jgi:AraC family transcriptional regulator of adaptative response / DNA-3-methyladenine glycosylase II